MLTVIIVARRSSPFKGEAGRGMGEAKAVFDTFHGFRYPIPTPTLPLREAHPDGCEGEGATRPVGDLSSIQRATAKSDSSSRQMRRTPGGAPAGFYTGQPGQRE